MRWLRAVGRASIWHRDSISIEDYGDRHTLRIWLPLFDLVAIGGGLWATFYGSPILRRLFPVDLVEVAAFAMALAATVCLIGVAFPRLWPIELIGKLGLIFLFGCYAGIVAFYPSNPDANNGFVVFVLILAMFTPFARVSKLAERLQEWWQAGGARG